ncbi:MAG TPA: M23 family metallopeptidase [Gaiellaceae bacterium]|jgi:murein DD-endopeptidase MepM/ murein hydrolase activator NlpD
MRRGIPLFCIVLLAAAFAAAVARADGGVTTGTTTGTTDTTTTTTGTTTTTATTTQPATTTTAPTYAPLVRSRLPKGCVGAGVAAIAGDKGAVAALKLPSGGLGPSEYPASHPYLTLDSASPRGSGCSSGGVTLTHVSLFDGAVTASVVTATNGRGKVTGLAINGSPMSVAPGQTVGVGRWGLLEIGATGGRLSAPVALRLLSRHGPLPARTTIFIGFAAARQPSSRRSGPPIGPSTNHRHHPAHHANKPAVPQPLTVTPGLGIPTSSYVFPVDGGASWGDTYGAGRNDIYDGWHHGDDLFAPLGTPLVAVTSGTLTLVGWNELGGWRVWLTDAKGNSFYYAHMAGYARTILHDRHVKAGQVIGFLGRTGDAFPTPPHLHFEVHPHQLGKLGYDGAVDPSSYLRSWHIEHLPTSAIPAAARLRAPAGTPSQEAAVVWDELLTARHLMPDGEPAVAETQSVRRPFPGAHETAAFVDARRLAGTQRAQTDAWPLVTLGAILAVLAVAGSFALVRRRRTA